jgi:hypothetical protein
MVLGRLVDCAASSYVTSGYLGLSTLASNRVSYATSLMAFNGTNGTTANGGGELFAADVPYAPFDFVIAAGTGDQLLFSGSFTPPPFDDAGPRIAIGLTTPNAAQ